jgi:hypothetical protein
MNKVFNREVLNFLKSDAPPAAISSPSTGED